jgi:hypothetical protein
MVSEEGLEESGSDFLIERLADIQRRKRARERMIYLIDRPFNECRE